MRRIVFLSLLIVVACKAIPELPAPVVNTGWTVKQMPEYPQVGGGDAEAGYEYLIYGDYIGSGIPYEVFKKRLAKGKQDTVLNRTGLNEGMSYVLTAFEAKNGVEVVNGNCLTCHAGKLNGEVIIGLGNSFSDFESNLKPHGPR